MRYSFFLLFFSLFALPAAAISPVIDNLDSKPHRLGVRPIGGDRYERVLAPGERVELYDHEPTILNLDDPQASPIRTDDDEEYVFWKNGSLQLQKYNFRQRGRGW